MSIPETGQVPIGNHESELIAVREFLQGQADLVLAFAYGSVAAGHARPDSDIDIGVLAIRELAAERIMELTSEVAGISGRPVDLVDLRTAGPLLGQQVLATGQLLFAQDSATVGNFISRTQLDAADFLPIRSRAIRERLERWIGK